MKRLILTLTALLSLAATVSADGLTRSFKRGFGENTLYYPADLKVLATGCSWFYDWGTQPASQVADLAGTDNVCEFVPMAWNGGFNETVLKAYYDAHPNDKYLLGFNEPNFKDQANMEPSAAVEPWYKLTQFAKANNLKVVAPALNYSAWEAYKTPDLWMDAFIAAYKEKYGEEPYYDYLALHCYMDDPSAMINYVETFAKKYDKQVWLTEFCAWENNSLTAAQQEQYMLQKVKLLEKSEYVYRYAWFKARNSNSFPYYNLVEYPVKSKGIYAGTLTDLGFAYVHSPNYDSTKYYNVGERIPANDFIDFSNLESIDRSVDPLGIDSTQVYFHGSNMSATYQINVEEAGDYYLIIRYSSDNTTTSLTSRINILDGDGNTLVSNYVLPNTGADSIYMATTDLKLTLAAGQQQITIKKDNARASNITVLKLVKSIDESDEDIKTQTGKHNTTSGSTTGGDENPDTPDTGGDTSTSDEIKITDAATTPFTFDITAKYYALYLDEATRQANISDDLYVNCGDNGTSQNSYVWENTMSYADVTGENSFGVTGSYKAFTVGSSGWSGFGYNIDATKGDLDLSCINKDYTFHIALKSESTESFDFYLTDGQKHTAHLVFGTKAVDGHDPIGNFARDGKWHNVDIPMNYLQSQYGLNFNKDTDYDGDLLCLNAGKQAGTNIAFDGAFFYGPADATPDEDTKGYDISVIDIADGATSEFAFSSSDRYYGIYLDGETRQANISDDLYINCGDNGTSQNSYLWENTFAYGTATGSNSFGVEGQYTKLIVNSNSWTGMGYNVVGSSTPLNLSAISNDYTLHLALRTTNTEPIEVVLNDGTRDAQVVLGTTAFDGHEALADFSRDGQWHEIYVPLKYLNSKFGTNFGTATNYTGNLLVIKTTAVLNNEIDYDAIFLYGPSSSKGIESETVDSREISITKASDNPFTFSNDEDYYIIALDSETKGSNLTSGQIIDLGPDDVTRHLYPWSDTFTAGTSSDDNSFGVAGGYNSWVVGSAQWSGLGYNIAESGAVDMSGITSEYTLHFAVKTSYTGTIEFYVTDGNGKSAYLPLGTEAFEGHAAIGDFTRDNTWYNIDVPVSYLVKQGLDYRTATAFTGNVFCMLAGGVQGTVVDYDAVFFHGPKKTTAIETVENATNGINGVEVYTIDGKCVATGDDVKSLGLKSGLYIVRTATGTKKLVVR